MGEGEKKFFQRTFRIIYLLGGLLLLNHKSDALSTDYGQSGFLQFKKITSTYSRDVVYTAIIYSFSADQVPNGSGAKTRTLGNFITHIDEIVRLAHAA